MSSRNRRNSRPLGASSLPGRALSPRLRQPDPHGSPGRCVLGWLPLSMLEAVTNWGVKSRGLGSGSLARAATLLSTSWHWCPAATPLSGTPCHLSCIPMFLDPSFLCPSSPALRTTGPLCLLLALIGVWESPSACHCFPVKRGFSEWRWSLIWKSVLSLLNRRPHWSSRKNI